MGRAAVWAPFLLIGAVGTAWWACSDDAAAPIAPELPYSQLCPRAGTGCASAAGPLYVGVARRDITPEITETFCDCGLDGVCPDAGPAGRCPTAGYTAADPGEENGDFNGHPAVVDGAEPFFDANGNGYFDAVWM